jgi:hypothetical protein
VTKRPPLPPRDTLQIHCVSCGRFLQSWVRFEAWQPEAGQPVVRIVGRGVLWPSGAKGFENMATRHVLQHQCRALDNRWIPTVVTIAKVSKLMDEGTRRADW